MSTVDKGTEFELRVARLFEQNGYDVTHNVKMRGKSGAEHQIDILAKYQAPLHTSTVIIETKSHQNNINKDTIMKMIHIRDDLSADRAILISTSSFTTGAISTAGQHENVELWDGNKVAAHLESVNEHDYQKRYIGDAKMIPFEIGIDTVKSTSEEIARKRSKGGLFGRGESA